MSGHRIRWRGDQRSERQHIQLRSGKHDSGDLMCTRNSWQLFFGILLGLVLATSAGSAAAGVVPDDLYQKVPGDGAARMRVKFQVEATAEPQLDSAEQPPPAPGHGPISPGSEPKSSPVIISPTEKATEVPIGRIEGYEQEKQKAQEIPFHGRPSGALQEDSPIRRSGAEPNSCSHK